MSSGYNPLDFIDDFKVKFFFEEKIRKLKSPKSNKNKNKNLYDDLQSLNSFRQGNSVSRGIIDDLVMSALQRSTILNTRRTYMESRNSMENLNDEEIEKDFYEEYNINILEENKDKDALIVLDQISNLLKEKILIVLSK